MTSTSSWYVVIATAGVLFMTSCIARSIDDVTEWNEQNNEEGFTRGRRSAMEKRLPRFGRSTRDDFNVQVGLPGEILSRVRSMVYSRLANREAMKRLIQNDVMRYIQKGRDALEKESQESNSVNGNSENVENEEKWFKRASSAPTHESNNVKFFEEQRRMGPEEFNPTGW